MTRFVTNAQKYNATRHKVMQLIEKYNLKFGVSSSAYQFEGAWNESGKGETMWSRFTREHPEKIFDHSTADISTDSYHNIERDINMLKLLGVQFYRVSISWSRLLPIPILHDGVSQEALQYYHRLIDQLKANNITPIVTLSHYDIPISVSDLGGWTNEIIIDYFEHFARIVFDNFADKVNVWITINQPSTACVVHYGSDFFPPVIAESGVAVYLCMRNMLLAHARVYHLYKNEYNLKHTGLIGIVAKFDWYEPAWNSTKDLEFITTFRKIMHGIFLDPIFSEHGDYPEIFKETVARKSKKQGFHKSRLILFTKDEVKYIQNTSDFLGLNYYSPQRIYKNLKDANNTLIGGARFSIKIPSFYDDLNYYMAPPDPNWVATENPYIANYPEGLKKSLLYVKNTYNNPKVFIMENGCGTFRNTVDNYECVEYFKGHLDALYDAVVNEGCNVHTYGIWSLMDGFEWVMGYLNHYGLFYTNFTDDKRSTEPKASAYFFREVLDNLHVTKQPYIVPDEVKSSSSKLETKYCTGYTNAYTLKAVKLVNGTSSEIKIPVTDITLDVCCNQKIENVSLTEIELKPMKIVNMDLSELGRNQNRLNQMDEILQNQLNKPFIINKARIQPHNGVQQQDLQFQSVAYTPPQTSSARLSEVLDKAPDTQQVLRFHISS
ncbi:myrosinase 1-like [Chrysoperla carnea]|uniref:myrosinase 1-like n=1 Tax=Chrysoperla carnea TaxID=189513 RepID=UPI001D0650BE|nr:myrosinase 1-like [Chrysoperla carnea]